MADFESSHDYRYFAQFIMRQFRHIMDAKSQRFLDVVLETSKKRRGVLQKDVALWRAQLDHGWHSESIRDEDGKEIDSFEVEAPSLPERMKPLIDRANEGRVNPKGIPCLYFSTDRDTAMTEVRPWIGSYVSVAQFVMLRDLTLVDVSIDTSKPGLYLDGKEHEVDKREAHVWWAINQAFSEPVTRSDDVADYAPTQVLAEAFRRDGCDGIIYGSKLGKGKTVAVFDLTAADLANCHLYEVKAVKMEFSFAANPYYIAKYCEAKSKDENVDEPKSEADSPPSTK